MRLVPFPLPPSPHPVLAQGMLGIHDSRTRVLQTLGETIITPPLGTATSMGVGSAPPSVSHPLRTPNLFQQSAEGCLMDHWSPISRRQGCQATGFRTGCFPQRRDKGTTWGLGGEGKAGAGGWDRGNYLGLYERKIHIFKWGFSYF